MITGKQKKFLDILRSLVSKLGYFPSVREIGKAAGLSSPATVHSYLARLEENGFLRRDGRSRALAAGPLSVPVVGMVPAGSPVEIFESLGEEIELPEWMIEKGGEKVALRVKGESMKDAFIRDGDVVIIKKCPDADSGDMVVALLEDSSITLKRLRKKGKNVWLVPENPSFKPIYDPFTIAGKVIGVMRRY